MIAALQPVVALALTSKLALMPFVASLITSVQLIAARSVGVRGTPARNFALYERRSWIHVSLSTVAVVDIQSTGIGHPLVPVPVAAALFAIAIAESRLTRAAAPTAAEADMSGMKSDA